MEQEDKRMLKRILELSEDNQRMVRKLYRSLVIHRITSIIYWVVIAGVTVGVYYYLQPFFDGAGKIYSDVTGMQVNFGEIFQNFLQKTP